MCRKVYCLFKNCAGHRREHAIRRNPHRRHTNVAIPWYRKLANWAVIQAVAAATAACSAATPIPGPTSVPAAAPTEQPTAQAQVSPTATQQPPTAEVTPTPDPNTWVRFYPPDGNPLLTVPCSNSGDGFASPCVVTVKAGAEISFNVLRAIAHKCQDDMSLLRILYFVGGGLVRTMVADDGNTYYSAQPPGCTPSECTPALDVPLTDITLLLYVNSKEVTDEVSAVQRGDLIIEYPLPTPAPTLSATAVPSPGYALCPVDLSLPGTGYRGGYAETPEHLGVDILADHGTELRSPGECRVISLFIDSRGTQGIHLSCSQDPILRTLPRISLGHVDLAWNNYAILEQYGIPVSTFFNDDGTPKKGAENVPPTRNSLFHRGAVPLAFVGNTGDHPMPYHVHLDFWSKTSPWTRVNPENYLDCTK